MDYKEKYEKAVQAAMLAKQDTESAVTVQTLEEIFPELRESEDEKIRKELLKHLREVASGKSLELSTTDYERWATWLEKQGKQKSIDDLTTQEAMDIAVAKCFEQGEQKSVTIDIDKMVNGYANNKEPGNEEFGKPVDCMIRAYRQGLNDAIRKVEQKPAWSEEDEMFVHGLIRGLAAKRNIHGHTTFSSDCIDITQTINWLKSLKDRYTWKPSDEQMKALKDV